MDVSARLGLSPPPPSVAVQIKTIVLHKDKSFQMVTFFKTAF